MTNMHPAESRTRSNPATAIRSSGSPAALSPLPRRHGLDSAWVRTPDRDRERPATWLTMRDWLYEKLGEFIDVDDFLREERFVYASGTPVTLADAYEANTFLWFHRDLPDEVTVPGNMPIVYRDERILVVDKPPFLSTIPRGRHVLQSVVARLRNALDLPELTPVHRLDRVTSGLLMLTTERRWRNPYQMVFQDRQVQKTYRALARVEPSLEFPVTVRNHLRKKHGDLRVKVVQGAPINAESTIELERVLGDTAIYRLCPHTGKTHQLRQHMLSLGIPIFGDPFYPKIRQVEVEDFSEPLQLLASELKFVDPVDGTSRRFMSERPLPIPGH